VQSAIALLIVGTVIATLGSAAIVVHIFRRRAHERFLLWQSRLPGSSVAKRRLEQQSSFHGHSFLSLLVFSILLIVTNGKCATSSSRQSQVHPFAFSAFAELL